MAAAPLSSLLPTPIPPTSLFSTSEPSPRSNLNPKTKKPLTLSCTAAAAPTTSIPAAATKAGSWRDLCSLNAWVVRYYGRLVASVGTLEPAIQRLSDEQLKAKTVEFRTRLARGETLTDVQAEAFAVVREVARRTLGMRCFDVQIIGGAVYDGCIVEMKTGEGKTLVSTLAAYLNALTGEGVYVVTVNDYMAQHDPEWMGRVIVGLIQAGTMFDERRASYRCDITYTNNSVRCSVENQLL